MSTHQTAPKRNPAGDQVTGRAIVVLGNITSDRKGDLLTKAGSDYDATKQSIDDKHVR
jgi:hypothetical protein